METKGTKWFCDHPRCKEQIFLEDGEGLDDAGWIYIPTDGTFCEEHKGLAIERAKSSGVFL